MLVFGSDVTARGCFVSFDVNTDLGKGAYVELPDSSELPDPGDSTDPMIVTSLSFAQKETYHLVRCFNDIVHTYAFGHDPQSSMVSVVFTGFIIKSGGTQLSNVFQRFVEGYRDGRLSNSLELTQVVIGSSVLKGYLVSQSSSTADSHHNLQNFNLDLLAVEVQE